VAVAALIVNYRAYPALGRCLASLMPHLSADDEVAVVDWESDAARLQELARVYPRVAWVATPANRGFAAGVNLAAAATKASTLLLLNPDATIDGPVPRRLDEWLQTHPECAVVGPRVLDHDGSLQASARHFPGVTTAIAGRTSWLSRRFPGNWLSRRNLVTHAAGGAIEVDWLAGSCLATPRTVFEQLGGFDERFFLYWEDADYGRRATALGYRCHYVPFIGDVIHVGGESSSQAPARSVRAFHRSAMRLFWKHARFGRLVAPVVWAGLWLRGEWTVLAGRSGLSREAARP
jgi:hypothetical protein